MITLSEIFEKIINWFIPFACAGLFTWLIKNPVISLINARKEAKQQPMNEIKELLEKQGERIEALDGKIEGQSKQIKALDEKIEKKHSVDPIAEECDLAGLDDRICTLIAACRAKGYTTAEERRRGTRMHKAYSARNGNHGEQNEYEVFKALPSEEEFFRTHQKEERNHDYEQQDI